MLCVCSRETILPTKVLGGDKNFTLFLYEVTKHKYSIFVELKFYGKGQKCLWGREWIIIKEMVQKH